MPRYLLAAEADKIQDFIFRAAKLREVVGGSHLLARFCEEGVNALKKKHDDKPEIIISDGGAFRLVFDDEIKAKEFGNDLAELYRRCAGGTLTVAKPVEYDDSDDEKFKECNDQAQAELRNAKSKGDTATTAVHLPYTAFCASCGVGIAAEHSRKLSSEPTRKNYLCADCRRKTEEKFVQDKLFIGAFYESLRAELKKLDKETLLPDEFAPQQRDWVDVICKADPRNYVAYLVADGNGMGKLFSECNKKQLQNLSKQLTAALHESLAKPCATMLSEQEKIQALKRLPVVPLILGGDDLFALLPAPFALDFARAFCVEYEKRLKEKLEIPFDADKPPTISAAVVICKSNYPHTLAHQRAEAALKQAKEMARRIEVKTGKRVSTLNFDIVTGNQVIADRAEKEDENHATLRPYFVSNDAPNDWGINIGNLIEERDNLNALPGKRRAEFERRYAELPSDDKKQEWQAWCKEFNQLRKRLKADDEAKFETVLEKLGDAKREKDGYLRETQRALRWYGHGLPDLLEAWDFAYKLEKPMNKYEEE